MSSIEIINMNKSKKEFINYLKRKSYKELTVNDYERTLNEFIKYVNANFPSIKKINDINRDIILNYEKFLIVKKDSLNKIMSRNRRRKYLTNLKSFFNFLEKEEHIQKNPTLNIALPKEKKTIIKNILTIKEMQSLLSSCNENTLKCIRDRAILETLYSTAIRSNELCNIQLNDIDFEENTLFIRKGKYNSERYLPFGDSAKHSIQKYLKNIRPFINHNNEKYLFVSMTGKQLQSQSILDIVEFYSTRSKIKKKITTHTFRHSCATHMLKNKADIRHLQIFLGHKRLSTTEKYLQIEISDLKEVHLKCHPREKKKLFKN